MAYMFIFGECINCHQPFSFNPHKVPSIRVNGKREPVCSKCIGIANQKRISKGMQRLDIHHDAYEPEEC